MGVPTIALVDMKFYKINSGYHESVVSDVPPFEATSITREWSSVRLEYGHNPHKPDALGKGSG